MGYRSDGGMVIFGPEDDQAYREDLEDTVAQIDGVLKKWEGWDVEYHSSW